MWRFVAPAFEGDFKVVLMDHVGAGGSDISAYDSAKYASLDGYADDIVELGRELSIHDGIFVGHSVSAMIGVLASIKAPELFDTLILVGPSPRYIDDTDYTGGFGASDIEELLARRKADLSLLQGLAQKYGLARELARVLDADE